MSETVTVIAIDGPVAAGKGTLARRLAAHFGLRHLDSGMLYRAVASRLLRGGDDPADETRAVAAARALVDADLVALVNALSSGPQTRIKPGHRCLSETERNND